MKSKLAVLSLALGVLSFVNLFGLEKALLAVITGGLALKELLKNQELSGKKIAYSGIILGSVYVFIIFMLAAIKGPQMLELLSRIK